MYTGTDLKEWDILGVLLLKSIYNKFQSAPDNSCFLHPYTR